MKRRDFLTLSAGAAAFSILPKARRVNAASANLPVPYDRNAEVPMGDKKAFIEWMVTNRGEDPQYLAQRFERFQVMVANKDVLDDRNKRAFLFTPREEFVLPQNMARAYDHAFLDIGYGVTISGPHLVGRMTTAICHLSEAFHEASRLSDAVCGGGCILHAAEGPARECRRREPAGSL